MKKVIVYNKIESKLIIASHSFKAGSKLELAKDEAEKLCKLYPTLLNLKNKKND